MLAQLLLPALCLLPLTSAEEANLNPEYTVWASVIYTRTGDRTPVVFNDVQPSLTALGAYQAHLAGELMRARYMGSYSDNGASLAHMPRLSLNDINPQQIFVGSQATQYAVGTAQAFLQGFYPPTNESSVLANDTEVNWCLHVCFSFRFLTIAARIGVSSIERVSIPIHPDLRRQRSAIDISQCHQ